MIKRFGEFYDLKKLLNPLGGSFLSRKNICIFTSHMNEPRGEIFRQFSKHFVVDGYGPFFNKKIKNHNISPFIQARERLEIDAIMSQSSRDLTKSRDHKKVIR